VDDGSGLFARSVILHHGLTLKLEKIMKLLNLFPTPLGFVVGLFMVWNASAQTPVDYVANTFAAEEEAASWTRWWGAANQVYEFDAAVDAGNNAASGSLKATIDFDRATHQGDNQFALVSTFAEGAVIDGTTFTNLEFDIRWSSASPQTPGGNFGFLEVGFKNQDFSQTWLRGFTVSATPVDGWIHVVVPIDSTAPKVSAITGVVLKMWSGDANNGLTGSAVFWIDNVKLIAKTDTTPPPPPTLSLEKATQGLRIIASAPGSQYQRQAIRTTEPTQSWVGVADPVTYSMTINDAPGTNNNGYQVHMMLVQGVDVQNFVTSPDWNQPHVVFLEISQNGAGGATATFRYKTNLPNGNSMYYNANPTNGPVGALAAISDSGIRGTWSLRFAKNTDVTLTAPSGVSTNFTLPSEGAELFADSLYAYFGFQPNQLANIGTSATLGRIQISGTATPVDETFIGMRPTPESPLQLDPALWQIVAEDPAGVNLVPPGSGFWTKWTVPAAGFKLQTSPDLNSWIDVAQPQVQAAGFIRSLVPKSSLANPEQAFFRLIK